ncbi:MAG: membrane protein insertion efficiency factor YidD [Candidatus Omnitrophica bacterium]|nr:membrane protein insertion efficiency factor YidD [Candidatus Omnitrophota bacterium]
MRSLALWLISFYRRISYLLPHSCLYSPTCSEYARKAFLKYSFLEALRLTFLRILRCNPFVRGGHDPLR